MVIYCTEIFTGALEYKKETFWMLPVSIIKKKYFRGLSNKSYTAMTLPGVFITISIYWTKLMIGK